MSTLAWIAVYTIGLAVGLLVGALRRRARSRRSTATGRRRSPRHPVFRRKPGWMRNPAREMPKRFMRRFVKQMPAEDLNGIFDRIVERNFPEAARADAYFDRLANEVVPDTAVDGEDPK